MLDILEGIVNKRLTNGRLDNERGDHAKRANSAGFNKAADAMLASGTM